MKKSKALSIIIVVIVSILLVFIITKILLNNNEKINQGNFRVNDLVIESSLDVEEINEESENTNGFESMLLNLSQRNNILMLVAKQSEIKKIYIDNLSITAPTSKGDIIFYQNGDSDEQIDVTKEQIEIYSEEKEDQILINLNIDNVDFLKNAKIPNEVNSATLDGTLIKVLNLNMKDIKLRIKYNINIIDEFGKLNVCNVDFELPDDDLKENGISIVRKKLTDYKFTVEDNFIKKILNKLPF